MSSSSSSSQRVVACAMLLFLQSAHGFIATVAGPTNPNTSTTTRPSSSPSSQLSMAWTLPNPQDSFKPTWTYQEVGNPTARRVVYDDSEFDNYYYDDEDSNEFYVASFGSDWSATATYDLSDVTAAQDDHDDDVLPRGARIGRAARRAIRGLRNTLRP